MCSKLGFYSLSGKVFDCDSKDIGSIPIKNPYFLLFWRKGRRGKFRIYSYIGGVGSNPTKSIF